MSYISNETKITIETSTPMPQKFEQWYAKWDKRCKPPRCSGTHLFKLGKTTNAKQQVHLTDSVNFQIIIL